MALIVIRLHPIEPVSGNRFKTFLDGLSIEIFDLGMANLPGGASLGVAQYLAPPTLPPPLNPFGPNPNTDIVQHAGLLEPEPFGGEGFQAVATAVLQVPAGAG